MVGTHSDNDRGLAKGRSSGPLPGDVTDARDDHDVQNVIQQKQTAHFGFRMENVQSWSACRQRGERLPWNICSKSSNWGLGWTDNP